MIDTDTQYEAYRIRTVTTEHGPAEEAGWTLSFEEGSCLWITGKNCTVEPQPGETARLYGKGFGYRVRGVAIDGRVYRYLTPDEDEAEHARWCEETERARDAAAEQHKAEIAQGQHAPVAFLIKESARADYEKGLANNSDPYGRCCYLFAAEWASNMEKAMTQGASVADVAKAASSEANKKYGVTGFMYGAAVSILSHAWEHGEALRRWHNTDTQIGTEGDKANESGGVLNPAMLSIG